MKKAILAAATLLLSASAMATQAPAHVSEYIISPQDGATVSKTFTVKFGLSGMGVAPAGINVKNTGHHHLLIDLKQQPDLHKPLPANAHIRHFGGGQTETQITLPPGKHTLQLMLGDYMHVPFSPVVESKKITVYVQ